MPTKTLFRMAVTLATLLVFGQRGAFADSIEDVTVNTSSLGAGSSEVFFILTGTGGNAATLSGILLGGGSAGAVDLTNTTGTGTTAGNGLTSGVSLNDATNFLNVFAQSFTAGGTLTFVLDLTTNVVLPTPDQFSFAILDPSGNPIPTYDPTGFDNLITINLDSTTPTPNIYSELVSVTSAIATPEPSSLFLLASGLLAFSIARKRFRADVPRSLSCGQYPARPSLPYFSRSTKTRSNHTKVYFG
jgi:hypothetical protein